MHGDDPLGCVDRRKSTGFPRLEVCEFDGRLSLVQFRGHMRLYARSNLRERAFTGGRAVQTSASVNGVSGPWSRWEPVRFLSMEASEVDLYVFGAVVNPVHPSSLLALFSIAQPPHACVAMAFSTDGVQYSRPISLLASPLGWRTLDREGSGPIEWRAEDHPAFGVVLREGQVWMYVQHSVQGLTTSTKHTTRAKRTHDRALLARYRMAAGALKALTIEGLAELNASISRH